MLLLSLLMLAYTNQSLTNLILIRLVGRILNCVGEKAAGLPRNLGRKESGKEQRVHSPATKERSQKREDKGISNIDRLLPLLPSRCLPNNGILQQG